MLRKLLAVSLGVVLLAISLNFFSKWIWKRPNFIEEPMTRYDVIIVGAGSAGCVVARRLWEKSNLSILLIEAGDTAPWFSGVPLLAPALQGHSADWAYKTVPQKHAQFGLKDQRSVWPRGKALGGSSVLNYMLHMWGSRDDFDGVWSQNGAEWNFESVLPYFRKSERFSGKSGTSQSGKRGVRGPMPVDEFDKTVSPLAQAFIDGASTLGIQEGDLNGGVEHGAMLAQSNILNGWRYSTFDAYLDPILENSNIHVLTNTMVVKVVFDDCKAVAVVATSSSTRMTFRIEATHEVILSAGVIGSAHLLMLSGIGPQSHLEKHEIPVVLDVPAVGQGLRDHLNLPLYFHVDAPISTTTSKVRSVSAAWKFLTKGKGYFGHSGVESMVRLPVPSNNSTHSKLFFMLFNLGSVNEALFTSISNFKKDDFRATFPDSKNDSKEGFILLSSCTHPQSVGRILLSSSNPFEPPLIDPRYLSRVEDVKCFRKAIKMAAKLGSSMPLRELGAKLHLPNYSRCSDFKQSLEDNSYLECWLRTSAITAYHPVGTCAIGSVLDQKLRVIGTKNLRVIDSSAFPHLTSGNPHAVVLMLAEKGATYVLEDIRKN